MVLRGSGLVTSVARMRINTSKSEAMILRWKKMGYLLQVGEEILPQVEEFKYHGDLFSRKERMERQDERRIDEAAVMRTLHRSVMVNIYTTYSHELWVVTKRTRLWV